MPNKPKHATRVSEGRKRKHMTIETPCAVAEPGRPLSLVSREGHWHDAQISADAVAITAGYEDDSK